MRNGPIFPNRSTLAHLGAFETNHVSALRDILGLAKLSLAIFQNRLWLTVRRALLFKLLVNNLGQGRSVFSRTLERGVFCPESFTVDPLTPISAKAPANSYYLEELFEFQLFTFDSRQTV